MKGKSDGQIILSLIVALDGYKYAVKRGSSSIGSTYLYHYALGVLYDMRVGSWTFQHTCDGCVGRQASASAAEAQGHVSYACFRTQCYSVRGTTSKAGTVPYYLV